tara:strand:+ start:296 stop:1048 length:753 start_codon:yes stop_codon:yes gene_type:complete
MADVGNGVSRVIMDADGEQATVTNNKLDVNAYLNATPTIDIGDVSLLLGGTAADTNNGTAGAQTLRVTIASDTTGVLSIDDNGGSITVDNAALSKLNNTIYTEDEAATGLHYGIAPLAVRRDEMLTGSAADGDFISLSTDAIGHLYVTEGSFFEYDTFPMLDVDNSFELLSAIDSNALGVISNCVEIFLQADESNTGYIMVGDGDTTDNRGMKLNPGDTIILNVSDTRQVGLWGSADNQNLRCMITKRPT